MVVESELCSSISRSIGSLRVLVRCGTAQVQVLLNQQVSAQRECKPRQWTSCNLRLFTCQLEIPFQSYGIGPAYFWLVLSSTSHVAQARVRFNMVNLRVTFYHLPCCCERNTQKKITTELHYCQRYKITSPFPSSHYTIPCLGRKLREVLKSTHLYIV